MISTRRLVHISNAYAIFNMDRMKAISMCVNRFDDETKTAMVDLYTKVDGDAQVTDEPTGLAGFVDAESSEEVDNDVPF